MKLATTRSPKFRRLMNLTGLSRIEAAGTLELLWLWTMEQAPSGDVGRWEDMDIEAELDWAGEPGALVQALVTAGWLDRCPTHRLLIHDWSDHLPDFLQKRVVRGSLKVASLDVSGRREDKSGNVPVREGKGRVGKPREEKRQEPAAPVSGIPDLQLRDPRPLLNAITKYDGELDEKRAWLDHEFPLIEAEAAADKNQNRVVAITIRFYRAYLKTDRKFRNWESKQETRRIMAAHEAECLESMREIEEAEGIAAAHR